MTATKEKTAQTKKPGKRQGKLLIFDGTSFCYRAYYAIRDLSNSKGEPTNAIYGFITMLNKIIEQEAPDYLAICFDLKGPTFRHKQFEAYKAHRKPMPDDLGDQIEPIKKCCKAYRYALFEKSGYEADDIIGTLALAAEKTGLDAYLVTGDKDAMQLVNEKVRILNPNRDNQIVDIKGVKKKFDGLGPEKVVDLMALMGDASDNIPGVPGIGEKTAVKLIQEFGSVETLMEKVDKIKSKRQQELLRDHKDSALMSKSLARIEVQVPIDWEWDDLRFQEPDVPALEELFKRYEFRTLLKNLESPGEDESGKRKYQTIDSEKELKAVVEKLKKEKAFTFDTETTSVDAMRARLVGLSFSWKAYEAFYVPVSSQHHQGAGIPEAKVLEILKPVLENFQIKKYGQNIKYDWMVLKCYGIYLKGVAFDTMIASYLINPVKLNHNLDDIAMEYLSVKKVPTEALIGKGKNQKTMDEVPVEQISEYACEDADCVWRLVPLLAKKMQEYKLEKLFEEVEMPLMEVLAKMEINGVDLDFKKLKQMSDQAGQELEALTERIHEEAGESFNINSTKQLAEILFEKMKIPPVKKTKTGYSTDVSVLEKLSVQHELPKLILEYREKAKLKSTYLDALPEIIHPETRRIHTSYHQAVTATGRLSSSDPNLQNIPIKTEAGREIRKAFIPRSETKRERQILSADYSQVELRILAHLSGDKALIKAFEKDRDIHAFTATLLYGVSEDDVTREMRHVAKTINFSIIYGKTAYGLSQDLNIFVPEADGFIREYFKRYAGIKEYLDLQKEKAHQQGYLTTLLGRRSYFPEINASNMMRRQFAERAAINAPIQGSAADIIKLAMIAIQRRLEKESPESLMIMQVHDELVFDVPKKDISNISKLVRIEMENAYALKVPLKVDVCVGDSWYKK